MKLIGFNYTKIDAERHDKSKKFEKITQAVNFLDLTKEEISVMKNSDILQVTFEHVVKYEPNFATFTLKGVVLLQADEKTIKDAVNAWKKDKKIADDIKLPLYRIVLNRCALKTLNLEESLNIPHHMNLVNVKQN